jgi:uncharacterized membrane protein YfcA
MEAIATFVAIGALAGGLGGLLGVGGGLVVVPALTWWFGQVATHGHAVHLAVGTSLATIVATATSSLWAHHRYGAVRWDVLRAMAPGIVIGAVVGAVLARGMSEPVLKRSFGVFALLVALNMALRWSPHPMRVLPGRPGLAAVGMFIGGISAMLGIGGGTLTVPFLVWCQIAIHQAVATAAGAGLPIAVAGTWAFVWLGRDVETLPAHTVGFVHLPAFAGIAAMSVLVAPWGARLAHRLPQAALRRVFALVLAWIGLRMIVG